MNLNNNAAPVNNMQISYFQPRTEGGNGLQYVLEMKNICKEFNGNPVLSNVNFGIAAGEVRGLVGENGAGKSTLMKILAGIYAPDSGEVFLDNAKILTYSPKHTQELGIAMIFQETNLFPDLNVIENIFIRRELMKKGRWFSHIDWDKMYRETRYYLDYFGLPINPKASLSTLSLGHQKFVEIIKALAHKAKIIIMDEPTSALTESEILLLFKAIREVKKLGVITIFISHHLEEVMQIADCITILRDGVVIDTCLTGKITMSHVVKMMAGKEMEDRYPKLAPKLGNEILRVKDLGFGKRIEHIDFMLRKGEILGITGLSGTGKRTLAKTIFGINTPYSGTIYVDGQPVRISSPRIAIENGICYVAGTGNQEALIQPMSIFENITITNLPRVSYQGILSRKQEISAARDLKQRLEIVERPEEIVGNLSGGNQKKVGLAKWLFANSRVLIFDEPTSGIDISTKVDIYNIINELVRSGAAVIMITSDLAELLGMCDRIMVMYNGMICKSFSREEATKENILYFASGAAKNDDTQLR
jgi:ribose transport system ATP-binding protein